jgi:hypothetical protein
MLCRCFEPSPVVLSEQFQRSGRPEWALFDFRAMDECPFGATATRNTKGKLYGRELDGDAARLSQSRCYDGVISSVITVNFLS